MRKTCLIATFSLATVAIVSWLYVAPSAKAQRGTRTIRQAHHDILWSWLRRTDYRKWNGPDGRAPEFVEGQSPHGALIKTYVNGRAESDLKKLPSGSVIVKENYSPDKKLMAITVMQRAEGYDSQNADWYYAKYLPNGTIDVTPPEMKRMPVAGKFKMCIDCHSGAGGGDFAFFND